MFGVRAQQIEQDSQNFRHEIRKRENPSRRRLAGLTRSNSSMVMDEMRLIHELLIGLSRHQYKEDLHFESDLHQVPEK